MALTLAFALVFEDASAGEATASEPTPSAPTMASRAATARGFELDGYDMSVSLDNSEPRRGPGFRMSV
jgi:hypothetical protein